MYQLTALYNQPADPTAFDKHYDNVHTPLASKIPGLQRLTVQRPAADPEGNPSAYFLIASLEFADEAAFGEALTTPEAQATTADLANFPEGVTLLAGPGTVI